MQLRTSFIALLGIAAFASSSALAGPSCDQWKSYSRGHQTMVMSGVFERPLFESLPTTRECMRSIEQQLTVRATDLCDSDSADFDESAERAMIWAVHDCQGR